MQLERQTSPLVWDLKHLRIAIDAAGVALWSWNVDTDQMTMDERAFSLWAVPSDEPVTFEVLSTRIHPHDLDRVRSAFTATRAVLGAYEIDFRILIGDQIRWISARGQGDDVGIRGRIMFGIFLDVTQRKQSEEAHELLAGEMSHRVKNLLAMATALTTITSRSATTAADMARQLTRRLTALGRAHELVQPKAGRKAHEQRAALLGDLLTVLLAPYDDLGTFSGRVRVSVPRLGVGEAAATALALVVHELATNSLKYGSLSAASGTLDISCTSYDDDVVLVWIAGGGASVMAPAEPPGFGNKMVSQSMSGQLGGSIGFDWSREGAIVTMHMAKDRLSL